MNIITFMSLYLMLGTLSFLFVVHAFDLKAVRTKTQLEAVEHMRVLLNGPFNLKIAVAFGLVLAFFPAMLIAEFFYDWE